MSKVNRAVILQLGGVVLLIGTLLTLCQIFPIREWLNHCQAWLAASGSLGMTLFPLIYALTNILLLPGGILNIGAGFFYGVWVGFALIMVGNILSAAVTFWIGRTIGRSWIEKRWMHHPKWKRLDHAIAREGWKIILLSQLNPLFPTSLINYFYGVSRIRFWSCVAWVAIGQMPSRLLYAYLGAAGQYGMNILSGTTVATPLQHAIWLSGLVIAIVATLVLGVVAHNILKRLGAEVEVESATEEIENLPATT